MTSSMRARAHALIDPGALPDYADAVLDGLVHLRLHAALLVQHAFGGGDDDLGALVLGRERFQRVTYVADVALRIVERMV
jgi:hypothetical protein